MREFSAAWEIPQDFAQVNVPGVMEWKILEFCWKFIPKSRPSNELWVSNLTPKLIFTVSVLLPVLFHYFYSFSPFIPSPPELFQSIPGHGFKPELPVWALGSPPAPPAAFWAFSAPHFLQKNGKERKSFHCKSTASLLFQGGFPRNNKGLVWSPPVPLED